MNQVEKKCSKCQAVKPLEGFNRRADRNGQPEAWCKVCKIAAHKAKYVAHPRVDTWEKACTRCGVIFSVDKFPMKGGRRRAVCAPCHAAQNLAYKQSHRDKVNEQAADYRSRMGTEILTARVRSSIDKNPEKYKELHSAWRKNNRDRSNLHTMNRRARLRGDGGIVTDEEWADMKKKYDYECLRCHMREPEVRLEPDHVIPVTKNGPNLISNIQPLCRPCNEWKFTKTIDFRPER